MAAKKPKPAPAPTNVPLNEAGRALLQAILRSPDDFEARLVFADYLLERGDPRGEFIELQCALGRPLTGAGAKTWHRPTFDGDPAALEKRERALIKTYEKQWLEPIRPFIRTWRWSRGFVDRVVADSALFLQGAPVIFATTPLVEVQLTALTRELLQALSVLPAMNSVRALNVSSQKLDASSLQQFEAPTWRGLRSLNLGGNRVGLDGAVALSQVGFAQLERLTFNDAHLNDASVEALSQAAWFGRLLELELGWNADVTVKGVLAAVRAAPRLQTLRVRSTGLVPTDFEAIAAAAPGLQALQVSAGFASDVRRYFSATVKLSD